jgi:RecB family exonuclease
MAAAMGIERQFFDWSQPALRAAADWLIEGQRRGAMVELGEAIVVVPGARAGRRLLELLVERCEEQRLALVPPRIITPAALPELLYPPQKPLAGELCQQLAWVAALKALPADELRILVRQPPDADDLFAWLALGELLSRVHRELAADGLDFSRVAEQGRQLPDFDEHERWRLLTDVQRRYLAKLDGHGLWDKQTARLVAIERRECATVQQIVLVGTVDMDEALKRMLDQVADRATALVFGPADAADKFDGHGCLVPAAWQSVDVPVPEARMHLVDLPGDQADAAVEIIAGFAGQYAPDEISIGAADPRLVPYLAQRLAECGLAARYGPGKPLAATGPMLLLEGVADYLDGERFTALAALWRHPLVERWLRERQHVEGDWLAAADKYFSDYLPRRLGRGWLRTPPPPLDRVRRATEKLLAPLRGAARPPADWGPAIVELLATVCGAALLDVEREADRQTLLACDELRESIGGLADLPAGLAPRATGAEALRLVLRGAGGTIPEPADPRAIELLGWLELSLDDAPALIVTGMNEGFVPAAVNADPFLPDALRARLQLDDNAARYARDAYALCLLAASRGELHLVAGRRAAEGEPLLPSRLLLACPEPNLPARVVRLLEPAPARRLVLPGGLRGAAQRSAFAPPAPQPLAVPVRLMRVSEFRDYLACPYRYYLKHRLGLRALGDAATELDAAAFGSLVHAALAAFGDSEARELTDEQRICEALFAALDEIAGRCYSTDNSMPAVRVQVELARERLRSAARWQAQWRQQGWSIAHVELGFQRDAGEVHFAVDGRDFWLHGRIDRIDRHERTGAWAVLDYKTGDKASDPDRSHRTSDGWIDLQLPLYRHLAASIGVEGQVKLGYIVLPKSVADIDVKLADWDPDALAEADERARQVVRDVWAGRFEASPGPPRYEDDFAAICHDRRFAPPLSDEED